MMKRLLSITLLLCSGNFLMAQALQNVGIGTAAPKPSAALDVTSSNKGMLIPRLTSAQRKAIADPEFGLMAFDTDKGTVMFFDGQKWRALAYTDENSAIETIRSPNDPSALSYYGTKVAMSGDYAIVGAPKYTAGALSVAGAAYILFKGSTGWAQQAKLVPPDSTAGANFGISVAISGDYAVVGAGSKTVGTAVNGGKIYVYKRNGTDWLIDTVFTKPGVTNYEYFGWSVAVSSTATGGPVVAAGVPNSPFAGASKGEVYTYKRNLSNTWQFIQALHPADLAANDNFGACISMDGDYMSVGAPYQDNTASYVDAGAVYIFVYGGSAFTQQQKITAQTSLARFGSSIAIDGSQIAIGAPWAQVSSISSAAVYLYARTGATWNMVNYLFLRDFEIAGFPTVTPKSVVFGLDLALSGSDLIIGAAGGAEYPNGNSAYTNVQGSAYLYKIYNAYSFSRIKTITPPNRTYGDLFGTSIGLWNGRYIIGNPKANAGTVQSPGGVVLGDIGN